MAARAFDTDLRRGLLSQFTTENIFCSKKIHVARFLPRRVPLGSGLWHNTDADISGAFPPRSRRMSVMSLHPHVIAPVPEETARVARAAFPKGHPYLTFRDVLGTIFQDEDFTALFPAWGQPGLPPWRLALVTIMQFRENLADRQAAEAVRARIGWEDLLSVGPTDPGFDFSVLREFPDRPLMGNT